MHGITRFGNQRDFDFCSSWLTIKNTADSAVTSAKKQAGATVTLSVNREAMMKAFKPGSEIK